MYYNVYFLYASLIVMGIIGVHYGLSRKSSLVGHTIFNLVIAICGIDVVLDLITCYLIEWKIAEYISLTAFLMNCFFLCQILLPYIFLLYSARVFNESGRLDKFTRLMLIPISILALLCVLNTVTHVFFYFDSNAEYIHGPLYYVVYINSFVFTTFVLIRTLRNWKANKEAAAGFFSFILIDFSMVLLQMFRPNMMTIGFGIGLGIMMMYIQISNPNSFKDFQSGAFNRRGIMLWLEHRQKPCYAVVLQYTQLTKMGQIYSAKTTDELLKKATSELNSRFGEQELFRVSNEEFISLTDSEETADEIAAWTEEYFKGPVRVNELQVVCHVRICTAYLDSEILKNGTVLQYCDYLLQRCELVHSQILKASSEFKSGFVYEQEIERFLISAVEKDLFEIYMQPIFSISEQRLTSVEVLSRLKHPTLGMISPELFISIAERNGSIDNISWLQFNRLCAFLNENRALLDKLDSVKYNLSPHELIAHDYGSVLVEIIKQYGLPAEKFEFEITESAATEYGGPMKTAVKSLLDAGAKIVMDDFGSGYANMSNVLKLPFSSIKLDRSLVLSISRDEQSAILYHDLVQTFHRLGYSVIGEGVETKAEYEMLQSWGVELIQGFYFSKPLPTTEILEAFSN